MGHWVKYAARNVWVHRDPNQFATAEVFIGKNVLGNHY